MTQADTPSELSLLQKIEDEFSVSAETMRRIMEDFHQEMIRGLAGQPGTLRMIPTYVDRPTGEEKGTFIGLDLGGTNFRILELELQGKGLAAVPSVMHFILEKRHIATTGTELFGFLADSIRKFLDARAIPLDKRLDLGFTFSFPVEQTRIDSGTLARWTKGFSAEGVIGRDIVALLRNALAERGLGNITVTALANDTVGTLVAKCYEDPRCDVGVIIGTGTNACYSEFIFNIPKWKGPPTPTGRMIINTEWGNFNKLRLSRYDRELDAATGNPGEQVLEKMVSGMYLGEVVRLIANDFIAKGLLFSGSAPQAFTQLGGIRSEDVSRIEQDPSADLSDVRLYLETAGVTRFTAEDRQLLRKICEIVSLRAARVSAAALAAVIAKLDPDLLQDHTVAIDGSMYEKHPNYSRNMENALHEIFGEKSSRIGLSLTKDGSGKGVAIIAAVASSR